MVNNDVLAIASTSLLLYLLAAAVRDRFHDRQCLAIGVALAVALVARSSVMLAAPLIVVGLALSTGRRWRRGLTRLLLVAAPMLVIAIVGYARVHRWFQLLSEELGTVVIALSAALMARHALAVRLTRLAVPSRRRVVCQAARLEGLPTPAASPARLSCTTGTRTTHADSS